MCQYRCSGLRLEYSWLVCLSFYHTSQRTRHLSRNQSDAAGHDAAVLSLASGFSKFSRGTPVRPATHLVLAAANVREYVNQPVISEMKCFDPMSVVFVPFTVSICRSMALFSLSVIVSCFLTSVCPALCQR